MAYYFYTWRDVEDIFEKKREEWPDSWLDVKVYQDSIVIYFRGGSRAEDSKYLKALFSKNYKDNAIHIDFMDEWLDVYFEEDDEGKVSRKYSPLFRDAYYSQGKLDKGLPDLPGSRIIAFHSYKGGVGRTVSLISLLRECTSLFKEKQFLLIDADLEAPGLTWMMEDGKLGDISYTDILSVFNYHEISDAVLERIAEIIKKSRLAVVTDNFRKEQFFVPAYREKEQIMNIPFNPEFILRSKENKFNITEGLSKLGKILNVDAIFVDLRAGVSEYSAPFLFDPRVEKYYVTSTSLQSVKGLNLIMEQIYKKTNADFLKAKIVLTMIPETMAPMQRGDIENQLLAGLEESVDSESATFLRDDYVIEEPFERDLVHTEDFASVCRQLEKTKISAVMHELAQEIFPAEAEKKLVDEETRRSVLQRLNQTATEEITAEGTDSANMLVTLSIKEIARNFQKEIPRIVIAGAKGAGKTYIYKKLLSAKQWPVFVDSIIPDSVGNLQDTYIIPLLATMNGRNMKQMMDSCIKNAAAGIPDAELKTSAIQNNFDVLRECMEEKTLTSRSKWAEKWESLAVEMICPRLHRFAELDDFLQKKNKKIVFIIDGIEDLCMDFQIKKDAQWKLAVQSVCQDVINRLDNLDYGNIGMIVFARKDMLSDAIETNFEQFMNLYQRYELNWTQTEALRLALWLADRAWPQLSDGVRVEEATRNILVEKLSMLWGKKLGKNDSKEAFSDRWILAALSDFNGQLQARDIVRFLKFATDAWQESRSNYPDRLIMPAEIRDAIRPCSSQKLEEIRAEMKDIFEILNKFSRMKPEEKTLPLTLDKIELTGEEIAKLEVQGFLKIVDKKYYLPEIIRRALGFSYVKGARPKVLSLLVQ